MINIDAAFAPLPGVQTSHVRVDDWRPIMPVPADAPRQTPGNMERLAPAGYTLSEEWRYRDATGRWMGSILRFDRWANGRSTGKQFRPYTFCAGLNGQREWRCKGFADPRPLYGLHGLSMRPAATVLVVEGEKTADAAQGLFPDYLVVTSSGGSQAARKTDWTPLVGRRVVIWPDADEPGARYGEIVAQLLRTAGAASVRTVSLPALVPIGWDLADPLPDGVSADDLSRTLTENKSTTVVEAPRWPAVIPIASTLPQVEKFIPQLLPEAIRDFVLDIADRQQAPPDFAAVAALCGLAAVIGNRVRIRPKQNDDWEVVPNLWGAIIGRPSAMKSPAMSAALAPINAIEDDMRAKWKEETETRDVNGMLASLDAKNTKRKAEAAHKTGDREGAHSLLAGLIANENARPCPRIIVNDATVEKLGELLNENPRGLLLIRDELAGFLARLESEEHQSERAFYLEAYNGDGRFTYDRIGRGTVHIESCTVSIVGGIQPSRIAPIVRGAMSGTSNDGLIQRLQMAVWPDDTGASWRWTDRKPNVEARLAYEKVFRDLNDLAMGIASPAILRFSPESQLLFQEWMTETQTEARSGSLPSILESHILKMPKTVATLALLFELIDGGRSEVNKKSMERALGWAEYLRSHANRLYSAGQIMAEDGARLIVARRHLLPDSFSARDVRRKEWASLSDQDAVESAIELLVATHHCCELPPVIRLGGGRPSVSYAWNPSLKPEV